MATCNEWNDALAAFLFRPEHSGRVVALGLGEGDIAEAGQRAHLDVPAVDNLIEAVKEGRHARHVIGGAVNRFVRWDDDGRSGTPPFIAHLAVFVHAILNADAIAAVSDDRNVHGRICALLGMPSRPLRLDRLAPALDALVDWANSDLDGSSGRITLYRYGKMRYVGVIRGQGLLTANDRDAMTWVFAEEGIPPGTVSPRHSLAAALRSGSNNRLLPRRVGRALEDEGGRELLLQQAGDLQRAWQGDPIGPDPRPPGQPAPLKSVRIMLATRHGMPTAVQIGPVSLRVRDPSGTALEGLDDGGAEFDLPGAGGVTVRAGNRFGWSSILTSRGDGEDVLATSLGWPGGMRMRGGGFSAARPASQRAILEQPSWTGGLVEIDDPAREIRVGGVVVLLADDPEKVRRDFPFVPPVPLWRRVPEVPMWWVRWEANQPLLVGSYLETAYVPPRQGIRLHRWPKSAIVTDHHMEAPLLIEAPSDVLAVADAVGKIQTLAPLPAGRFVLEGVEGDFDLRIPGVTRGRRVRVRDVGLSNPPAVFLDFGGRVAQVGAFGARVSPTLVPVAPVAPAMAPQLACPHVETIDMKGNDQSASAVILGVISVSPGGISWSRLGELIDDLEDAGFPVVSRERHAYALQALGHVEQVVDESGSSNLVAAPPILTPLPEHPGQYVLCGARTRSFLACVKKACEDAGAIFQMRSNNGPAPAVVLITGDTNAVAEAANSASIPVPIEIASAPVPWGLVDSIPSLVAAAWPWTPPAAPGAWTGWHGFWMNRFSNRSRDLPRTNVPPAAAVPTVTQFRSRDQSHSFLVRRDDGILQEAPSPDLGAGRWAALALADETAASIWFDPDRLLLAIRSTPRLPRFVSRAFTLCSGFAARVEEFPGMPRLDIYPEIPEPLIRSLVERLGVPIGHINHVKLP